MAISFSGLASGLDTSSWIQSLTNLKRTKVTVLETQRETIIDQRDTLAGIKSFFNSFRSMLEKVTDTKLGIPQMDLFSQNLATSADLSKFTASATTDAQEGNYNIKVDKLATNTQAVSGYRYTTVYEETTMATYDSRLKDIGVKSGNISVTVGGIEKGLHIDETDTIGRFSEKLKSIGVESSYNEQTGVFAVNVSIYDIHDVDLTGIVDRLHLSGVNEGYKTGTNLQTSSVEEKWDVANENTKLSQLGVHTGHIYISANDDNYDIEIETDDTIGDLINALRDNDIDASITDGIFRINSALITDDTTTDLLEVFGLSSIIDQNTQHSGSLDHVVTVTNVANATTDTLLSDLGEGVAVSNGDTVIVKNSNDKSTTITIQSTSTLGDLLTELKNAGLSAQLNNDGFVEISGGKITGGSFDITSALGLQSTPYTAMVTGSALTETTQKFELVTYNTKLVEDLNVKKGYLKVTDEDGQINYLKIKSGETIQNLMADLAGLGISSVLGDDGVLTITGGEFESLSDEDVEDLCDRNVIVESDATYKHGTDLLYLLTGSATFNTMQTRVASSSARTMALRVEQTNTILASTSTELSKLGLTADENTVFSVRGDERTIAVTTTMTIQGLLDALHDQGISASFDSETAKISLDNANILSPTGVGTLHDALNLETTISGKYVQSNNVYTTMTTTIAATNSTALRELGVNTTQTIQICNSTGVVDSVTVNGDSTLGSIIGALQDNTIAASVTEGKLNISGGYIANSAVESALGLVRSEDGTSRVVGAYLTTTGTVKATGATTLSEVIQAKGTASAVSGGYNLAFNGLTINVNSDTTIDDVIAQINYSSKSNATAYWDSVDGKLVIKSRSTGASLVNIEAISSNFTDVMGFTTTEWNDDNSIKASKLNINSQEVGQNSSFSINGTQFTSSSNTVTSDVSKIMGVTINLKDVTEGSSVQLKIEKDKESVATAVSNIVDSYNELIENVEAEVAATGSLKSESGLKMLRNQIRSLMTSSLAGSSVFKNLAAVGISTEAASAGNISTANISKLKFDKDKFISAFDSDLDSLKKLLVGTEDQKGVLVQVEEAVENALASVYGYFSTAEASMTKKITNFNNKIDKANAAVESYKARLEAKFSSMDLLISKMQNQYSSFLSGG